jgi:hypothetical protein
MKTNVTLPELLKADSIIVKVGLDADPTSQTLSKIVQEPAFKKGWRWTHDQAIFNKSVITCYPHNGCLYFPKGGSRLQFSHKDFYASKSAYDDLPFLDASTQLGLFLQWLNRPTIPTVEIHGHKGEYTKGSDIVKFGCAEIGVVLLRHAFNTIECICPDNRTVQSIKLSSGVELTQEEVQKTVALIDYVNSH